MLLLAVTVVVASLVAVAHAQQAGSLAIVAKPPQPQPKPQPQNVRCIKDSVGNYTCTDGTRVIRDSFDNPIVIPPRREERAR
jgi:hypothetical protein